MHNLFIYDKFSSHFYVFFSFGFDSVLIFINYDVLLSRWFYTVLSAT